MIKTRLEFLFLVLLITLTIFNRGYNLEKRIPFGWDQERDAQAVWKILREGKLTLIGPRVISDDAFFLGPLWYYLLVPFYFLSNLDPIAGGILVIFVSIITSLTIYFITRSIFGVKQGIIASLIWASLTETISWNPILIPLFSIILLLLLIKSKYKFIYSLLVIGLSLQLHFQAILLFIPFFIALFFHIKERNKLPLKQLLLGTLLFLITFFPLVFFDLRHDSLNLKGVLKIFFNSSSQGYSYLPKLSHITNQYFNSLSFFIPPGNFFLPRLLAGLVIFIISILGIFISDLALKNKLLILSLIFLTPVLFSFYNGDISEYYFILCFVPVLLGFSNFFVIKKFSYFGPLLISVILTWLVLNNIILAVFSEDKQGLFYKKQAVKYIINQKKDQIFNVSYSGPVNSDAGYVYLFKFFGKRPQNINQAHLWTIVVPANSEDISPLVTFGNIGIIRR